jgi:predicted DNA-binding transcriptional regulator AlpA
MQKSKQAKTDSGDVAIRPARRPLIFKAQLLEMLGDISPSTLWSWMAEGTFPAPLELGKSGGRGSACGWVADEVDQWIASRPRRKIGKGQHEFRGRREEGDAEPVTPEPPKPKTKRTAAAAATGAATR